MKILLIDNYDSFTYNLAYLLRGIDGVELAVRRNDRFEEDYPGLFDGLALSPGPGIPEEAGLMPDVLKRYPQIPTFGVCLGHQAIAEAYGAKLENMGEVVHGKALSTSIVAEDEPLFQGIPSRFDSGRYHSWIVSESEFPDTLLVTSVDDEGRIMSLRHREYPLCGVQFHPESILTEHGATIVRNWVAEVQQRGT